MTKQEAIRKILDAATTGSITDAERILDDYYEKRKQKEAETIPVIKMTFADEK